MATKMDLFMREGDQIELEIVGLDGRRRAGGGCHLYLTMGMLASSMEVSVGTKSGAAKVIIDGGEAVNPREVRNVLGQVAFAADEIGRNARHLDKNVEQAMKCHGDPGSTEWKGEQIDGDDTEGT